MRAANGAPGGARLLARASRPGTPTALTAYLGPGSSARRPADRKAGLWEPIARLPAPPGAPFPSFEGRRKKGPRARPGARKQTHGTAKRWLSDECRKIRAAAQKNHAARCAWRRRPRWFGDA